MKTYQDFLNSIDWTKIYDEPISKISKKLDRLSARYKKVLNEKQTTYKKICNKLLLNTPKEGRYKRVMFGANKPVQLDLRRFHLRVKKELQKSKTFVRLDTKEKELYRIQRNMQRKYKIFVDKKMDYQVGRIFDITEGEVGDIYAQPCN